MVTPERISYRIYLPGANHDSSAPSFALRLARELLNDCSGSKPQAEVQEHVQTFLQLSDASLHPSYPKSDPTTAGLGFGCVLTWHDLSIHVDVVRVYNRSRPMAREPCAFGSNMHTPSDSLRTWELQSGSYAVRIR